MRYNSKIDWWAHLLFLLVSLVFVCCSAYMFVSGLIPIGCILIAALLFLILPIYFATYYIIADCKLIIKSGFIFTINIPVKTIIKAQRTNSLIAGFALSLDRLKIVYIKNKRENTVYVSPIDRHTFVKHLLSINPNIDVSDDFKGIEIDFSPNILPKQKAQDEQ